jgi:hypothetical protein
MQHFLQRFGSHVLGVLSGFDRLRFRGTLRMLANQAGLSRFLSHHKILLKDCTAYLEGISHQLRLRTEALANQHARPLVYLPSSATSKEQTARDIAQRDGISSGLICVLSCVEPCQSYRVLGNRATQRLELQSCYRKCLHYYHYFFHPTLGFMHARLQSWFPFTLHINANGREWLAKQMDQAGITYHRSGNCFLGVQDFARAQALLDSQLRVSWPGLLAPVAEQVNFVHDLLQERYLLPYYWSADETEWATDLLFRSAAELAHWYPRLVRHGLETLSSLDVMRFLGKREGPRGGLPCNFQGEVVSDVRARPEGVRIKHRINHNSIKMYDKQGAILRVETTISDPHDMKVYRQAEGDEQGAKDWRRLRKGVADLQRRAEISQAANERYLEMLAGAPAGQTLQEVLGPVCRAVRWQKERVRGLNPLGEDQALLRVVNRGEYALQGFRNRDVRGQLYGEASSAAERLRQAAQVTRQLRRLRGHGLIHKIAKTHRYQLSERGRAVIAAALAALQADPSKLADVA